MDPSDPISGADITWDSVAARPNITRFFTGEPWRQFPVAVDLKKFSLVDSDHAYVFPLHRHKLPELMIPLSGMYRCALNHREIVVAPGDGLLIVPGDLHEDRVGKGARFLSLVFAITGMIGDEPMERLLDERGGKETEPGRRIFQLAEFAAWERLFLERVPMAGGDTPLRRQEWSALGVSLVWRTLEALRERLAPEFLKRIGDTEFHQEVKRIFRERLGRPPSTGELARTLGLSRRGLEEKFKRLLGATPARAFAAWRTDYARELLVSGMPPKMVARTLGFASQSHFGRIFKKYAGVTASTFSHGFHNREKR